MSTPNSASAPLDGIAAYPSTPVGFYCDHSDEPHTASSHHEWVWIEGQGLVFQHEPDVVKAFSWPKDYFGPEKNRQCPRAVPVYAVDVPGLLGEVEIEPARSPS